MFKRADVRVAMNYLNILVDMRVLELNDTFIMCLVLMERSKE